MELQYIAENKPSLCIPHVFINITENRIRRVFDELNLGKIKRIDIIQRRNSRGQNYNRVFIHFYKWYNSQEAVEARTRLISGKDIKIVYDNPWFWKVSANKVEKKTSKPKKIKPHICFESSEEKYIQEEDEDINPQQIIRSIDDENQEEKTYVPDYGNITPPKCRSLIKKRNTKLDMVMDEISEELYGDLDK